MANDLQKRTPTADELMAQAASGQVFQGGPSVAELMRRRGMTTTRQSVPALAAPEVSLGAVTPLQTDPKASVTAEELMSTVANLRRQALDVVSVLPFGSEQVNARAKLVALPFQEYMNAARNRRTIRDQLQKKIDREGIFALNNEDPETMRFVGNIYDSDVHTPDFKGYLRYLESVAPIYAASVRHMPPPTLDDATRKEHTYITGSPGSGKTELLKTLILHDIEKNHACVIIDPTGNLARSVARWPEFAGTGSQRLAYFAPDLHETLRPVLNPLDAAHLNADERGVLANQLTDVLAQVIGRGGWSSQAETLASNCFHVLLNMEKPDLFFLWRALVGTDKKGNPLTEEAKEIHRRGLQHPLTAVRYFFEIDFFDAQFSPTKSSLRAKIGDLLKNSTFVDVISGPSTLALEREIEAGRVIIFNLEAWQDDAMAGAFGRMVIAQLAALGMRRSKGQSHPPVHVYVDEVSVFVSPAIIKILYRLRQNGIHLTMAQQSPGDGFEPDAKRQLITSTAIKFAAGSGQRDMLAAMPAPADAMRGLKKGEFIGRWGHGTEPFKLAVRRDRADFSQSMTPEAWEEVKADQVARYYRPQAEETVRPSRPPPEGQEQSTRKKRLRPI